MATKKTSKKTAAQRNKSGLPPIKNGKAKAAAPAPAAARKPRTGTKQETMIAKLRAPAGITIAEASKAMGWQAHTTRAFLSATLGKKLGLKIAKTEDDKRGWVYRIAEAR